MGYVIYVHPYNRSWAGALERGNHSVKYIETMIGQPEEDRRIMQEQDSQDRIIRIGQNYSSLYLSLYPSLYHSIYPSIYRPSIPPFIPPSIPPSTLHHSSVIHPILHPPLHPPLHLFLHQSPSHPSIIPLSNPPTPERDMTMIGKLKVFHCKYISLEPCT